MSNNLFSPYVRVVVPRALALMLSFYSGAADADSTLAKDKAQAIVGQAEMAEAAFDLVRSYYTSDNIPLEAEIVAQDTIDGAVRETVRFRSFDREMVTAYLARPAGIVRPPVVIALHGITQSKNQWWLDGGPWSFPSRHREILLKNGIAVLAIDARNHGERILENDFRNPLVYLTKGYFESTRKIVAETAIDVRRAIDYLETRQDVDAARVGLIGFSLGAHIGWIATAVDPRVDRALIMAMPFLPAPKELRPGGFTAPRNYLVGLTGRAIMIVAATHDEFYTAEQVSRLFEEVPTNLKEFRLVESGHDLPASTARFSKFWFVGTL